MNIFDAPSEYLKQIQENSFINEQNRHNDKSMMVAFFTKVCKAGCPFCFFKSDASKKAEFPEKQELSQDGFTKFINLVNSTNVGYLMISGGGEPFEKPDYIVETIKQANNYENAENLLKAIYAAKEQRQDDLDLVLRVSVDKHHVQRIGSDKALNIVGAFENNFLNADNFRLQFHTMQNDKTVPQVMEEVGATRVEYQETAADVNKNKNRYIAHTPKGLEIQVEEAKQFFSNIKVNLNNDNARAEEVFFKDLRESQGGNFSKVQHPNGQFGLDFLVNYNGNVTTWGNYHRSDAPNLYLHTPEQIIDALYNNIISYSFIDKDFDYRKDIVSEVNPKATDRAVGVNIRDFSGAYLLEENKTALYYGIRVMQDYIKDGKIDPTSLKVLSPEIADAIFKEQSQIAQDFKDSSYNIFNQLAEQPFAKEVWQDTFELCKLGHYDITPEEEAAARELYSQKTDEAEATDGIKEPFVSADQQERLLNKFNPMNAMVEKQFRELYTAPEMSES